MKIEIDTDEIFKNAIGKLAEDDVLKSVIEDSRIEDMVEDIFSKEDVKNLIRNKAMDIIEEYFSSDNGREYVIDAIKGDIDNSDLLADDRIVELVAEFLKKKLELI